MGYRLLVALVEQRPNAMDGRLEAGIGPKVELPGLDIPDLQGDGFDEHIRKIVREELAATPSENP